MTSVVTNETYGTHFDFYDLQPLGHEVVEAVRFEELADDERQELIAHELRRLRTAAEALASSDDVLDESHRDGVTTWYNADRRPVAADAPKYRRANRIVGWLSRANYTDLQEFCEWNSVNTAVLQARLDRELPAMKEYALDGVDTLIAQSAFPKHARRLYETTLRRVDRVYAMDSFTAGALWAYAVVFPGNALGFADTSKPGEGPSSAGLYSRGFHEFKHMVANDAGCGFRQMILMDEPIVEQAELSISGVMPDPHNNSPYSIVNYWNVETSYFALCDMLHAVCQPSAPIPLTVAQLNEAYYDVSSRKTANKYAINAVDTNIRTLIPAYRDTGIRQLCSDVNRLDKGRAEHDDFLIGMAWHAWLANGFTPRSPEEAAEGVRCMAVAQRIKARLDATAPKKTPVRPRKGLM